jgi:hypothetical protein
MYDLSHRFHGAGIYANIDWGYIDGIHGAPYMDIIWYMASYGRLILWYIDGIHVTIYENVTHGIYGSTMDPMATGCPHGFVLHTGRHGTSGCIGRRRLGVSTRAARRFQRCASVVLPLLRRRVHGLDMEKRIGYRIYDEYR